MEIIYQHFECLTSTNDWAKEYLKLLPKGAMALVTTDTQTNGRGQYGRHWVSPKGVNIYASFGFFVGEGTYSFPFVQLLAQSTATTLAKWGVQCQIKWPNDLLVNGKKIAGILCETVQCAPDIGIVIGIGLNVNSSQEQLERVNQPATSLLVETDRINNPQEILTDLKDLFVDDLAIFFKSTCF
ncbi:MAG TPA: biotin--[acetyl-CoA-carboxylase] ligase [Waddliaceae bacterium]